jgi:uncharacterized damage-inducible protein DinB
MDFLPTINSVRCWLSYSDWANGVILSAARPMTDAQLDTPFEMGRGCFRKTLLHLWAGESVWVSRWQGKVETPWPDEEQRVSVEAIAARFEPVYAARNIFLATQQDADLSRDVIYRDSKGSLFQARLGDMMTQMLVHSTHHRAQLVNMLRRLGVDPPPELDYMMWRRRPIAS